MISSLIYLLFFVSDVTADTPCTTEISEISDALRHRPNRFFQAPTLGTDADKAHVISTGTQKVVVTQGMRAGFRKAGFIVDNPNLTEMEIGQPYNFVVSDTRMSVAKIFDEWEITSKHKIVANRRENVFTAGEIERIGENQIQYNLQSGTYMAGQGDRSKETREYLASYFNIPPENVTLNYRTADRSAEPQKKMLQKLCEKVLSFRTRNQNWCNEVLSQ